MNSENKTHIYLPITVKNQIDKLIQDNPNSAFYQNHLEKIYYLSSKINFGNYDKKNDNGEVQISSKYFRKLFGKRYFDMIIKFLLENNIIQYNSNKKYSVGNHCKHYRINPIYYINGCKVERIKIYKEKFILKLKKRTVKVKESVMESINNNNNSDRINNIGEAGPDIDMYLLILKPLNQLEIDYYSMEQWINNNMEDGFSKNKQLIMIDKIKNGNCIDIEEFGISNNFRLHTPITALKKELRQYIKGFDAETDISNSQILFLYCLMIDANINITDDVKLFGELVSKGKFYEFFVDEMNKTYPRKKEVYTRDEIKDKCLSILYCSEFLNTKTNDSKLFQELFPNVFNFILSKKKGKDGGRNFAILQQRNEALFMLPIAKRLIDSGIPILTIHDSFLHQNKYSDLIRNEIETEFKMKYNLDINLKTKYMEN